MSNRERSFTAPDQSSVTPVPDHQKSHPITVQCSGLVKFMPLPTGTQSPPRSLIKQCDLRHRQYLPAFASRQDSDSQMADAKSTALWPRCSRAWVVVWFIVTAVTAAFATSINSSQVLYGRARPFESCSNTSAEYGGYLTGGRCLTLHARAIRNV